ncbi:MAG: radical SAM protein [bacterium]
MKIAFINPPFLPRYSRESRSPAVSKGGTLYFPMWLSYAAGYCEVRGHNIILNDYSTRDVPWENALIEIEGFSPDIIFMNVTTGSSINDYLFAAALKEKLGCGVHISLVGTHVSAVPEDALDNCRDCDSICRGEFELTASHLADTIYKKADLSMVTGISLRGKDGKIVNNPDRKLHDNLDDFPMVSSVYKKYLNHRDYFYGHSRHPIITIVAGRGCPHRCVFCVYPQIFLGHKYRKRTPARVVDEMIYIEKNFHDVKEIMFEDDTLSFSKSHTIALCDEMIRRKTKLPWSANSRAELDYETLNRMRKAGCRLVCVGFESGDQEMLNRMRKNIKLDTIREFVLAAKRAGILVHGCFMIGNPGETSETLMKTLEFAKEINPDTAQFFPIMIYPGTQAYNWAKENGYITAKGFSDWITEKGLHNSVVSTPQLSARDLVEWCDRARKEFYLRPSYFKYKLSQVFRHPGEFKRNLMGFARILPFILRGTFGKKT